MLTHYEILTVSKDAPISVITAVYHVITEKYSPEKYEGAKKIQVEKAIQRLDLAYHILSDPIKRKTYDDGLTY